MVLTFSPVPYPHTVDYIVIAIFLCICIGIGIYYGYQTSKKPTLENYFLGNRRLLLLPVTMSLFVTFISAISVMGIPAETYVYGIRGAYFALAYTFSALIATVTVVPLLYPLRLISTYEYLELRFRSRSVRTLGAMIGMLQTVAYMGVSLYAPGLALEIVAGIPLWLSIIVIGLVGTIYTAIGGIKSVVWTDAFQFVMVFIGLVAVTVKGIILMGHHSVLKIATEGGRLDFFNFDLDPRARHTIWGMTIGLTFSFIPTWCNQAGVQRVSSLRSLQSAKIAYYLLGPMAFVFFTILGCLGILLYSYYNSLKCDPVQAGFLTNFNQLMPYFVLDVMRSLPGLSGIFISCLFSAALSTLSSGINALAANTVEDILGHLLRKSKMISQTFAAKLFVFSYGLIVIGLAYAINSMSGSITQGAIIGSVTALVFDIWITIGSQMYGAKPVKLIQNPISGCFPNNLTITMDESSMFIYKTTRNVTPHDVTEQSITADSSDEGFFLYDISYVWYGLIGFALTLIIGTLVSLCTGGDRGEPAEARLIFPICRKMWDIDTKRIYRVAEMEEKNLHLASPEANGPLIYSQPNNVDGASPLKNQLDNTTL